MKQALYPLLALTAMLLANCGGQKPPAAAKGGTTTTCCDSATLAKCCADTSGAGCGNYAIPAVPAETAAAETAPAQCTS